MKKPKKMEAGDEDVDIGDEMPMSIFPPVEIEKDKDVVGGHAASSSSSSSSSSSDSSSSSGMKSCSMVFLVCGCNHYLAWYRKRLKIPFLRRFGFREFFRE